MKRIIQLALTVLGILGMTWAASALSPDELDKKAQRLIAKFDNLQANPDKRIPADILRKARGIILLDRTKAGFIFAYQGGGGVALVKDKKGQWSPMAFMSANEASLGFQVGGQQTFLAILLMDELSVKTLIADAAFEFGGEARGTAGKATTGAEGKVDAIVRSVMIYDEREGLFGGAAVKGGAISPDHTANRIYYAAPVSMQQILFDRKVKTTRMAGSLASKLTEYAKAPKAK